MVLMSDSMKSIVELELGDTCQTSRVVEVPGELDESRIDELAATAR
jgi:hypothetical protein